MSEQAEGRQPGWGIIATGWIAHQFVSDIRRDGMRVTAVASRTLESARAFAGESGIPSAYGSWDSLLGDPDVDIVYVATPNPFHAEAALAALAAGKHVLVEKPFTLSETQALEVQQRAERAGLVVMEAMWTRFLPHMVELRRQVEAGRIGDVQLLRTDHTQPLPADPKHRLENPELGGGMLLDIGIYGISLAVSILGLPREARATAALSDTGVDHRAVITMAHSSGQLSTVSVAGGVFGMNGAMLFGTRGSIEVESPWYLASGLVIRDAEDRVVETLRPRVEGRGMQFQAREMEKLVCNGENESSVMPLTESVAIVRTMDQLRRSFHAS